MNARYDTTGIFTAGMLDGIPGYGLSAIVISVLALAVFVFLKTRPVRVGSVVRQAPGSRIALAVGDRFAASDRFTGFVHDGTGASIVLVELPLAAYEQLQNLENAAQTFAAQGVSGIARRTLPGRAGQYIFLQGEQNTALVDYVKYILIFREQNLTGMVTANIPRAALTSGMLTGGEIESILKSAQIRKGAPEARKLFTLGYLGPFEEDVSLLGTTKGYRLQNGALPQQPQGMKPLFLVAPSLAQAPIPDLGRFAERTFNSIDQVRDKSVETMRSLEVAGLNAVEILGGGVDDSSREPAFVYQLIVEARHGGYFRLVGLAPESSKDRLLPEYKKIAESFQPA